MIMKIAILVVWALLLFGRCHGLAARAAAAGQTMAKKGVIDPKDGDQQKAPYRFSKGLARSGGV